LFLKLPFFLFLSRFLSYTTAAGLLIALLQVIFSEPVDLSKIYMSLSKFYTSKSLSLSLSLSQNIPI
jgi:hypothetical protein